MSTAGAFRISIVLLACLIMGAPFVVKAASAPDHKAVTVKLKELWEKRFPLPITRMTANPDGKGALRAYHERRYVYYYLFHVFVPRPTRAKEVKDGNTGNVEMKGERRVVVWVRYRSWLGEKEAYDLSFAREDLLPGSDKRRVKVD